MSAPAHLSILTVFVTLTAIIACTDEEDVGRACPLDDLGAEQSEISPDAEFVNYPEVVEINTSFPCDYLVCVSTDGREGYCSKECRADSGCPPAFECRQVGELGPLADRKYCVWRRCHVSLECGDVQAYRCELANYADGGPQGRCDFNGG